MHIIILDRELYRRERTKQQMMHDDADVTVCEGLSNSRPLAPSVDGRFLPVFVGGGRDGVAAVLHCTWLRLLGAASNRRLSRSYTGLCWACCRGG